MTLLHALWLAFLAPTAFAQYGIVDATVNSVGSGLPFLLPTVTCTGSTACGFVEIAEGIILRFRPLLTGVGVLVLVIAGYKMIVGQDDEALTKSRTVMTGAITGLVMVYMIDPFIHAFFGMAGEVPMGGMATGATVLTGELNGVINWALTIIAALAVLMIIVSALKAVSKAGGEEGITSMRNTLFSTAAGLLLLGFRYIISGGFVASTGNPVPLLAESLRVISYLMGFLGLIGVVVTVFAGFQYVLSMGKEEVATKSKGLLIRAAVGTIVILISLALVNFVILPGVQ